MEKSILQLSKESLTELSSLPHLKTEPKSEPKSEPKKKEGTAGRIGPKTLPKDKKKKKPLIGSKTKERTKSVVGDLAKAAGGAALEAGKEAVKDVAGKWVRKIASKISPKD